MRKRHRYVTVIVNGDTGQTLAMVPAPQFGCAVNVFDATGPQMVQGSQSRRQRRLQGLQVRHRRPPGPTPATCWTASTSSEWFSAGLTAVRRDIQRRPEGSKPAFDPEVFRARFALLRRGDTLTDTDRARLDALFDAHPRLKAGWQALQELHGLYLANDHQGALKALGRFCDLYETGELPEYHDTVDTIIAWSDEILAWHHTDRASNGRIEGINNLLQVLRRTAHGFTNPTNFEARGILVT